MNYENLDPKKIEVAKRLARGPLGQEVTKFPLRFAAVLFFANGPRRGVELDANNGTLSLLDLEHRHIGVTCFHVLEAYRQKREQVPTLDFYLGLLALDPLSRVIDQDSSLDLVTLDLSGVDLKQVSDHSQIGSTFFCPPVWPCAEVKEGDFVAFGGFPRLFRVPLNFRDIEFGSFSIGACRVASVHEDHIVCQIEREYLVSPDNLGSSHHALCAEGQLDLGGLSGGPVFILRQLHWEFVGTIYEYSLEYELLYIRPSKFISVDGRINRDSIFRTQ
jgi:hypothetical protein